jgi:hypothetical protein
MRIQTTFVSLILAAALAGCGPVVIQSEPEVDGGVAGDAPEPTDWNSGDHDRSIPYDVPVIDRPTPVDVGRVCASTSDCGRGEECVGGEGCGVPWTCQPQLGRPCTGDLAPFCGCDGVTFAGSSTCPQRPYAHRGPCDMPPPPLDGGPGGCVLPNGAVCPQGAMCLIECGVCFCGPGGALACSGGGPCVDAGPPPQRCNNNSDCSGGTQCVGPEGCGVQWTCQPVEGCTRDLGAYCACDGTTFYGSSTCPGHPYLHRGACGIVPPDAGPRTCNIEGVTCTVGVPCRVNGCSLCICSADGTVGCSIDTDCELDGGAIDAGPPVDASLPPVCPAQDARGVGNCAAFFGYAWNGAQCVGLGGCSCAGADCGSLARELIFCERAHQGCPRPI